MTRKLRLGLVLAVVLFMNLTPAFAIYDDCSQYVTNYHCFGYSVCHTT